MKNLGDYTKFVLAFLIVGLVFMTIDTIGSKIIESKVIENKNNYEKYDDCYKIRNYYYCEKAN